MFSSAIMQRRRDMMTVYRFERSFEPRGVENYSSTYRVYREDDSLRCMCDVYGMCIKGPTRFLRDHEAAHAEFRMEAKGKFMNTTYYLREGDKGSLFGSIKRPLTGHGSTLLDTTGRVIGQITDTATWKEAVVRNMLEGLPDKFAVVSDNRLIARIGEELRPQTEEPNRLKRFFKKLLPKSDWVLRLEPDAESIIDERFLIAGMILLHEYDTRSIG
jgi:hypothetical protein